MQALKSSLSAESSRIVLADGEEPLFHAGQRIGVLTRNPVGHYRVPQYLRGKQGVVLDVISRVGIDNEQEGFGRNAGSKRHYYRISVPMREIWKDYAGSPHDDLRIEVYETWLERR